MSRACIDCRHLSTSGVFPYERCDRPVLVKGHRICADRVRDVPSHWSPDRLVVIGLNAKDERDAHWWNRGMCGKAGRYFQPKDKP